VLRYSACLPGRQRAIHHYRTVAGHVKIEKLVENGKTVESELKFEPGVVSHPVLYRTSITSRSEKHKELIKKAEVYEVSMEQIAPDTSPNQLKDFMLSTNFFLTTNF